MKRFIAVFLLFLLLYSEIPAGILTCAAAEGAISNQLDYSGERIVWRSAEAAKGIRTFSLISELNVAYLRCDQTFLTPGKPATWTAEAEGGTGGYEYEFILFRQPPDDTSSTYWSVKGGVQAYSASNTFTFTITQTGTYIVVLSIRDTAGAALEYNSEKYPSPETDALVKKVKEIAALCNASASSSYGKALFMHDWLLNNASYSFNGPFPHEAEGVLLHGSGVCESYALAYQMLLVEVGVNSIFVTGYAGEPHAWNLVSMGGNWCHVDVTWDDTGSSSHAYFGMNDRLIGRDHSWTDKFPASVATEYYYPLRNGGLGFETPEEMGALIHRQLYDRVEVSNLYYLGDDASFDIAEAFDTFMGQNSGLGFSSFSLSYSKYHMKLTFGYEGVPMPTISPAPSATPTPTAEPSVTPDQPVPGDATNDGTIDILDLVSIIDYIVSGTEPAAKTSADANGDGTVDILDLVWIIDKIVGG